MKIELDTHNPTSNRIISYSSNGFRLKDQMIESNLVISKDRLIENWPVESYSILALQHLDDIISWQPEIILIGTGNEALAPNMEFIAYTTSKKIGLEIMNTGAACRSYNLLMDEGRNVVACLFLPETEH